jgi:predicted transcriptional regulator
MTALNRAVRYRRKEQKMQVNKAASMIVESIQSDASVREAATMMKATNVGLLLVAKGTQLVGVVTDRDIVTRAVAAGECVCKAKVGNIMSSPVVVVQGDSTLEDAAHLMSSKQIRRLVVTNDQSVPVGVLSIDDIAFHTHGDETAGQVLEGLAHGPDTFALFRGA